MIFTKYYSYDDVLLVPNLSTFSLEEISLKTHLISDIFLNIPIISAAMDTVTEFTMALNIALLGGAGVIHRNISPKEQANQVTQIKKHIVDHSQHPLASLNKNNQLIVGAAIAPTDYLQRIPLLEQAGVDFVVFDVAHGNSSFTLDAISDCKKQFTIPVMGGNTATADGTRRLIEAGADAIKVGVGAGSICTTRIICGIGIPQLSATFLCADECKKYNIPCISDGGLRYSGDIVKSIGAGANAVMLGNMLASTFESAGEKIEQNGRIFKKYRGMGSVDAVSQGGSARYQSEQNKAIVPEGVEGLVPCSGALEEILHQIVTGIKKGMWYCGQKTIPEMNNYKQFIEITPAGLNESHAHDLLGIKSAPNYHK
ncbi:MAG: IMP dehydrogenase [Brevinema sp.]